MFWYYVFRWLVFFTLGLPFQMLTYVLYPFISVWYWFFVRGKFGQPITPPNPPRWTVDYMVEQGKQDQTRDTYYLNNNDDTGPLTHMYLWYLRRELAQPGLNNFVYNQSGPGDGALRRRYPEDNWIPVSGDSLSSWTCSYAMFGGDKELLRKLAKHYLVRSMGLGAWNFNWKVSSRSSNGGFNFVIDYLPTLTDVWYAALNQPCLGPQYFTSAPLFLLASKELGGLWTLWYYIHFWMMGGFMYWLVPFVGPSNNDLYYVRQVTTLNAYSCWLLTKNPIYKWSLRYLAVKCAPSGNIDPLLYCWAAKAGALTDEELTQGLLSSQSIKRSWPQDAPYDPGFYDNSDDLNGPFFSISAAAALMIQESQKKK